MKKGVKKLPFSFLYIDIIKRGIYHLIIKGKNNIMKKYKDFISEIVDYNKGFISLEDLPDIINQNYYLYTREPVTLEQVKKKDLIMVQLINTASASETQHEYIYQIKVKKSLYKKKSLYNLFDDDQLSGDESGFILGDKKDITGYKKFDDSQFSGYFKKEDYGQEVVAWIKPEDITSFRHIGGFVKYDKNLPQKLDVEISEESDDFLYSYISGVIFHKKPTPEIKKELEKFKPKSPIKIYKGIEEVQIKHQALMLDPPFKKGQIIDVSIPHFTSWTSNILVARTFIDDYPSSPPFVVVMTAKPEDILVDVRMLPDPSRYYAANQREIIMSPGNYTYKIIWEGKYYED